MVALERIHMSKTDHITKHFFANKIKFADLFNGILFEGKQIIDSKDLIQENIEHIVSLSKNRQSQKSINRYRDCFMSWKGNVRLLLLGIENQEKIHYAMPLKSLTYDIMCYVEQAEQIRNSHREKKEYGNSAEFLSGWHKMDYLDPVITVVVYWGEDEWDGKLNFQDMIKISDDDIKEVLAPYLPKYQVLVVEPRKLKDLDVFQTSLRDIFGMMKYRDQEAQFQNYVSNNERLLDMEDLELLKSVLNDKSFVCIKEEEEAVTVCKATEAIYNRGKIEGKIEGKEEILKKLYELGVDKELIQKLKAELEKETQPV
ncbi:MAG: Rpn family recombination-promoting nuclease/putative transposase [Anaerostipes sp.]|jgi:hypothetical protein|nr:Rpn family recombination-promoting nuclease/putative transposase [Anaerostipes sp.]MDD3746963.1 Rpn family recombination-promoting nuclease/putative transposase [Anaerostipes sp.]